MANCAFRDCCHNDKVYDPVKPYKQKILALIQETWETPYVSVTKDLYPVFRRKFIHLEVDHTNGIGTKESMSGRRGRSRQLRSMPWR